MIGNLEQKTAREYVDFIFKTQASRNNMKQMLLLDLNLINLLVLMLITQVKV